VVLVFWARASKSATFFSDGENGEWSRGMISQREPLGGLTPEHSRIERKHFALRTPISTPFFCVLLAERLLHVTAG